MFGRRGNLEHLTDRALVENFKASAERKYFQEIFERYQKRIFQVCYHMVRDVALSEDLVQETFLRALGEIRSFDERGEEANLKYWLTRICKNLCLDELRKQRTRRLHSQVEIALPRRSSTGAAPGTIMQQHDTPGYPRNPGNPASGEMGVFIREAMEILDTLEERYRVCYLLFSVEGHSYEEISKITGFSFEEVKTCIRTARRNLEKRFRSESV